MNLWFLCVPLNFGENKNQEKKVSNFVNMFCGGIKCCNTKNVLPGKLIKLLCCEDFV